MIVRTEGTCGGRARIEGTRIDVNLLHGLWAHNWSDEQILEAYPHLKQEMLDEAKVFLKSFDAWLESQWHLYEEDEKMPDTLAGLKSMLYDAFEAGGRLCK